MRGRKAAVKEDWSISSICAVIICTVAVKPRGLAMVPEHVISKPPWTEKIMMGEVDALLLFLSLALCLSHMSGALALCPPTCSVLVGLC